jgi:hypothetical protein
MRNSNRCGSTACEQLGGPACIPEQHGNQTERPRENALQAATTYAGSIVNQPLRNRGTVCDDGLSHQITRAEQPAGFSRSRMPI